MTWQHFTLEEFSCKHCGKNNIDHGFVDRLDILREQFGRSIVINSGYRCPDHNVAVSSTGVDGPHTTGKAVDVGVARRDAYDLLSLALMMGFKGIGVQQRGGKRFLHLDDLTEGIRPTVWSY